MNKNLNIIEITSEDNKLYKVFFKLLNISNIKKLKKCLFFGQKTVPEILEQKKNLIETIIINKIEQLSYLNTENFKVILLKKSLFNNLDIFGTKSPILVLKTIDFPVWNEKLNKGLNLFLPFQDPTNIGSALRTAAAFNANVILLKEAANPFHPKSLRASGPAIFNLKIYNGPGLENLTQFINLPIYALALNGENIYNIPLKQTLGLVTGTEGMGLEDFWPLENRINIPMENNSESLNANISLTIAMAIYKQQYFKN